MVRPWPDQPDGVLHPCYCLIYSSYNFHFAVRKCLADSGDGKKIVPIAVGIALAVLIIVVIIAFIISKLVNRKKNSYEPLN